MWASRYSTPKVLFLLNRYSAFVAVGYMMYCERLLLDSITCWREPITVVVFSRDDGVSWIIQLQGDAQKSSHRRKTGVYCGILRCWEWVRVFWQVPPLRLYLNHSSRTWHSLLVFSTLQYCVSESMSQFASIKCPWPQPNAVILYYRAYAVWGPCRLVATFLIISVIVCIPFISNTMQTKCDACLQVTVVGGFYVTAAFIGGATRKK